MPVYTIRDTKTGKTLDVRGERPPTQDDAARLFGVAADQAPQYLDAQGNPIKAPPFLDAQGNPITPRAAAAAPATLDAQGNPLAAREGPTSRFFSGLWRNTNPAGMLQALVDPAARNQMAINAGLEMTNQHQKMQAAPTLSEKIGYGAGMIPFIGPAATHAGETIASGNYAGGAGETLGLIAPPFVAEGLTRGGQALRESGAADALDRAATQRFVDATAPKVGPNKLRLNRQMAKVAPDALRDPDLGAFSREGLHAKVQNGLADATSAMDEASDARLASQQVKTAPIVQALDAQISRLTAQPVEGSRSIPSATPAGPEARPLGQTVEPLPNASQLATLRQIKTEVQQLGPIAPYEAVRRIREAWDKVALPKYLPSTAADALKSQGEATAAVKGAGAMREALAQTDPQSAAAYQKYSLYRSLNDVLAATQEAEQARPRVGRGIMARATGAVAGGASAGTPGAIIGTVVGGIADRAAQLAPTLKIMVARRLAGIADALRRGDAATADSMALRLNAGLPAVAANATGGPRPRASGE